jgi:3alpha(or 20beta)-hydroxysteroid dehydrogenase
MLHSKTFAGKCVIVTGAARGTGAVAARRFAELGAQVVATDVATEGRADLVPLDVTREADWARVVGSLARVDVLVNNAAILHMGPLERTSQEQFQRVLDVNTAGAFAGIRAVAPRMKAQASGSIVNVTSVDSLLAMNGLTAYVASKWALRGLSKAAALELGRHGIRVNCVSPAGGNPRMFAPWSSPLVAHREQTEAYRQDRAIPREATLAEIAEAIAWLASDASGMVTGIDLPVDGGVSAGHYMAVFDEL